MIDNTEDLPEAKKVLKKKHLKSSLNANVLKGNYLKALKYFQKEYKEVNSEDMYEYVYCANRIQTRYMNDLLFMLCMQP